MMSKKATSNIPFMPYTSIVERFKKHISNDLNERIILSGAFGTGKTTFIKSYFEDAKEKYVTIRVSPVNYSVTSNDNIFELIKADIIKQLFLQGIIEPKHIEKVVSSKAWSKFAREKPLEFGRHLFAALAKLNPLMEVVSAATTGIADLVAAVNEVDEKLKVEAKERDYLLMEYLEEIAMRPGSYLEFNMISELVSEVLNELRESGRQTVFIVDDLDRLDPEHIFRILNVLSAHYDNENETFKFGFDKVICICDIANIKSVFHHRYGVEADFNGYIDKFYSEEPFRFDVNDSLSTYCRSLNYLLERNVSVLLQLLLAHFVSSDRLTIRQVRRHLIRSSQKSFIICEESMNDTDFYQPRNMQHIAPNTKRIYFESTDMPILEMIRILVAMFGSYERLMKAINPSGDVGKIQIPPALHESIIQAFIMSDRYVGSLIYPKKIFFQTFMDIRTVDGRMERLNDNLAWPLWQFDKYQYKTVGSYDEQNKYDGSTSYFKNIQFQLHHKPDQQKLELGQVFTWLTTIAEHVRSSELRVKLGIASA